MMKVRMTCWALLQNLWTASTTVCLLLVCVHTPSLLMVPIRWHANFAFLPPLQSWGLFWLLEALTKEGVGILWWCGLLCSQWITHQVWLYPITCPSRQLCLGVGWDATVSVSLANHLSCFHSHILQCRINYMNTKLVHNSTQGSSGSVGTGESDPLDLFPTAWVKSWFVLSDLHDVRGFSSNWSKECCSCVYSSALVKTKVKVNKYKHVPLKGGGFD